MASETLAAPRLSRGGEVEAIGLVSAAHFVGHYHMLVVPPLFALLKARWGVGFVELGLALTVYAVVSIAAQLPMGWMADRFGSRKLLIAALCLGGVSIASIGIVDRYSWLLVAAGLSGIANAVYHPADYAILSARVAASRIGRAFSIHTFAGMLGNALAPLSMLVLVPRVGIGGALIAAGMVGPLVALPLIAASAVEGDTSPARRTESEAKVARGGTVFTPAILGLMVFFVLLSLSTSGISNFSVPALMSADRLLFAAANLSLTVYLTASAFGVLGGGFVADLTRRHGEVAAIGFALNAAIVLAIGTIGLGAAPLVGLMGLAGFLSGMIMPSRDMLVRAAAPAGQTGKVFAMVSTGLDVGGMITPLIFGALMDHDLPRFVFVASAAATLLAGLTAISTRRARAAAEARG